MKKFFSMLLSFSIIVSVIPTLAIAEQVQFADIENHWAKSDIEELATKGVINGMGDGSFNAEGQVTRAQFIKLVVAVYDKPTKTEDNLLIDVPGSSWSNPYIIEGINRGIISLNELDNNQFEPQAPMNRDQVALWITRALGVQSDAESNFSDKNDIKYKVAVATAVSEGLVKGYPDNTYKPQNTLTRAESAVIIKRLISKDAEINTLRPSKNKVTVKEGVLEFASNSQSNILISEDLEKGYYVFDKIDDKIKSLKVEDTFIINPCEGIVKGIAIKVKEIKISGTRAEIWQGNLKLEDIIQEIDIAKNINIGIADFDEKSVSEGVTISNDKGKSIVQAKAERNALKQHFFADSNPKLSDAITASQEVAMNINIDGKYLDMEGLNINIDIPTPTIEADIDVKWEWLELKCNKFKLEAKMNTNMVVTYSNDFKIDGTSTGIGAYYHGDKVNFTKANAEVREKIKANVQKNAVKAVGRRKKIGDLPYIPVAGPLCIGGALYLEYSLDGSIDLKVEYNYSADFGFKYENNNLSTISKTDKNYDIDAKLEGTVKAGGVLEISGSLWGVGLISLKGGGGVGVNGKIMVDQSSEAIHLCPLDITLDCFGYMYVEIGAATWIEKVTNKSFSKKFDILNKDNATFYNCYIAFPITTTNADIQMVFLPKLNQCPFYFSPLKIQKQPTSIEATVDGEAVFFANATANNGQKIKYVWYKNDVEIAGEYSDTLKISPVSNESAGKYKCRAIYAGLDDTMNKYNVVLSAEILKVIEETDLSAISNEAILTVKQKEVEKNNEGGAKSPETFGDGKQIDNPYKDAPTPEVPTTPSETPPATFGDGKPIDNPFAN